MLMLIKVISILIETKSEHEGHKITKIKDNWNLGGIFWSDPCWNLLLLLR